MFTRNIQRILMDRLAQFPIVLLTGPRQSGKTTLLQQLNPQYEYINLELPSQLEKIQNDPELFLKKKRSNGLIIDEAQQYPELFSYIQVISDESKQKGQFILSGSQNFLLNQQISQSLAGRVAILELLPLAHSEYQSDKTMSPLTLWQWLYQGGYPRPYHDHIPSNVWLDSYVRSYLERDVRDLLNVQDLSVFQKFLRLCAGRHGQLLNINQLAIDSGISHTTAHKWLNILEASYLIFRLQPYHQNFNKRLIKSSKLYFYDSGLVCYLLGIDSPEHLELHVSRGAIFEGYILSELKKYFLNRGEPHRVYFWRDSHGHEIDCLIEHKGKLLGLEIKATSTFRSDLLSGLKKWQSISNVLNEELKLIYAGTDNMTLSGIELISWQNLDRIFNS